MRVILYLSQKRGKFHLKNSKMPWLIFEQSDRFSQFKVTGLVHTRNSQEHSFILLYVDDDGVVGDALEKHKKKWDVIKFNIEDIRVAALLFNV